MQAWIFPAILSALFAACVPILAKQGLPGIDSTTATAVRSFVMAAFFAIVVAARGGWATTASIAPQDLLWIAASGLAGALSWLCYFMALKGGPAVAIVALDRTSVIFTLVLAALFLAERITVRTLSGALLVALGAFLVAWR